MIRAEQNLKFPSQWERLHLNIWFYSRLVLKYEIRHFNIVGMLKNSV